MTRHEVVIVLRAFHHCILSVEDASRVAEPFGVPPPIRRFFVSSDHASGIPYCGFNGVCPGELVEVIAEHLGVELDQGLERGHRLLPACDAIERFLRCTEPSPTARKPESVMASGSNGGAAFVKDDASGVGAPLKDSVIEPVVRDVLEEATSRR